MNRRTLIKATAVGGLAFAAGGRHTFGQIDAMIGDDPMAAAVHLSELETLTHIPALYTLYGYMHPDAAEIVPRATVIGWYQEDFQPRGPKKAVATGVTWLDSWTWEVSGKTYTNVAEVSYTQEFADGDIVHDVVRLQFYDGAWRWWFGRSRAWVDEQNDRFSLVQNTPQEGDAPFGLNRLPNLDPAILSRLPLSIRDDESNGIYVLVENDEIGSADVHVLPERQFHYAAHEPKHEFGLGFIEFGSILAPESEEENMLAFADRQQNTPPVEFLGWNCTPENGPAWLHVTNLAADVVGPMSSLTLVSEATYLSVTSHSESSFERICRALAGDVGR